MSSRQIVKPLFWVGSSHKDLSGFPDSVKRNLGFALYQAQVGRKSPAAKPLKGFGGASVLEIVESYQTDAYRAVYTVQFGEAIYVLHAFQKKSKKGAKTPTAEMEQIKRRLKDAQEDYQSWVKNRGSEDEK